MHPLQGGKQDQDSRRRAPSLTRKTTYAEGRSKQPGSIILWWRRNTKPRAGHVLAGSRVTESCSRRRQKTDAHCPQRDDVGTTCSEANKLAFTSPPSQCRWRRLEARLLSSAFLSLSVSLSLSLSFNLFLQLLRFRPMICRALFPPFLDQISPEVTLATAKEKAESQIAH